MGCLAWLRQEGKHEEKSSNSRAQGSNNRLKVVAPRKVQASDIVDIWTTAKKIMESFGKGRFSVENDGIIIEVYRKGK